MTDKLPVEHIVVGNYLWYGGTTSVSGWNCPAKIVAIENNEFTVMSLDDMKVQSQTYSIVLGEHEPASRMSMRAITKERAAEYLSERLATNRKHLIDLDAAHERNKRETNRQITKMLTELEGLI